jgi:hypothetical protein
MNDVYTGLPRKIAIGQYVFRIHVVPGDHPKLEGNDGMTYTGENNVYLSLANDTHLALITVVHELTHCVNWARDVEDGADEEHFTTQHTNGVVEMWLRNPKAFSWVNKQLRAVRKALAA